MHDLWAQSIPFLTRIGAGRRMNGNGVTGARSVLYGDGRRGGIAYSESNDRDKAN